MKRFVGGLREALESPMSLVHNPALLTGRPKAAEGTEGAIVLAGETAWRSGTLAGMGTPRAACAAAPYSILALHQGLSLRLLMPWPLLHLVCCLPSSSDLSPCTHVFRPWKLLKRRPIPCCPSMHTQAAASACSMPALLFITRQHPHSESLPTGLVALPAEGKHWSEPNALVGRLTEAAASARQVFDAASQHYADSLERVGSGRSAGTSEEALPDWGAGPQRGQEPPPLKLGKVGWRPTCLSALG